MENRWRETVERETMWREIVSRDIGSGGGGKEGVVRLVARNKWRETLVERNSGETNRSETNNTERNRTWRWREGRDC